MSKLESNIRQRIIINCLRKKPCSFEELDDVLMRRSDLDERKYNCSERTFQREKNEILSNYNIEIKFNKQTGKYEIVSEDWDEHSERLMESYDMINALNTGKSLSQHLYLEKRKPLGLEHIHGILHAIKNQRLLSFNYKKYWYDEKNDLIRVVEPLALKESRYRWYLIARDTTSQTVKTYGLDRISNLEVSKRKFDLLNNYDIETDFKNSFGILNNDDINPEKIVLSLTPQQGKYIKSLPLHSSQKEILSNDVEYRIELFLKPTYDFEMEILSLGSNVKVVEPESLKESIKSKLKEALEQY